MDVTAPGDAVLSTLPGGWYGYASGTSMATPLVTGAVALMLSADPALTVAQVKSRLIAGTDDSAALDNRSVSDGELNVRNALINRSGVQITATLATTSVAADAGISAARAGLFSDRRIWE